jgi:hypothetical protein
VAGSYQPYQPTYQPSCLATCEGSTAIDGGMTCWPDVVMMGVLYGMGKRVSGPRVDGVAGR